ncbi:winged helix-turn-helix domain-containing protein [Pseudarthrobacter sp. J47]|jgi:predicted transcriptional regulator|uniref:winged helix-turn-helix domain-containing protein n=2 Tax=Pseudarthrobacter TaxID=1742993 RepID=UPI003CC56BCD
MANILMNRTRSRLIRYLITHGPATCREVGAALTISAPSVRKHLSLLCEAGLVILGSGTYKARPDMVERELADLAATFQSAGSDFRNCVTDDSHFSVSAFHSSECPGTSKRTN